MPSYLSYFIFNASPKSDCVSSFPIINWWWNEIYSLIQLRYGNLFLDVRVFTMWLWVLSAEAYKRSKKTICASCSHTGLFGLDKTRVVEIMVIEPSEISQRSWILHQCRCEAFMPMIESFLVNVWSVHFSSSSKLIPQSRDLLSCTLRISWDICLNPIITYNVPFPFRWIAEMERLLCHEILQDIRAPSGNLIVCFQLTSIINERDCWKWT